MSFQELQMNMANAALSGVLTETEYHAYMEEFFARITDPHTLLGLVYFGKPEWRKRYLEGRTHAGMSQLQTMH